MIRLQEAQFHFELALNNVMKHSIESNGGVALRKYDSQALQAYTPFCWIYTRCPLLIAKHQLSTISL